MIRREVPVLAGVACPRSHPWDTWRPSHETTLVAAMRGWYSRALARRCRARTTQPRQVQGKGMGRPDRDRNTIGAGDCGTRLATESKNRAMSRPLNSNTASRSDSLSIQPDANPQSAQHRRESTLPSELRTGAWGADDGGSDSGSSAATGSAYARSTPSSTRGATIFVSGFASSPRSSWGRRVGTL